MGQFTFIEAAIFWILDNDSFLLTLGSFLNTCLENIFVPCEDCGFPKEARKGR